MSSSYCHIDRPLLSLPEIFPGCSALLSLTPSLLFCSAALYPFSILDSIMFAPSHHPSLPMLFSLLCFLPSSAQWRRNLFMMTARGLSASTITTLYCSPIKLLENGLWMICSGVHVQYSLLCISYFIWLHMCASACVHVRMWSLFVLRISEKYRLNEDLRGSERDPCVSKAAMWQLRKGKKAIKSSVSHLWLLSTNQWNSEGPLDS